MKKGGREEEEEEEEAKERINKIELRTVIHRNNALAEHPKD